MVFHTKVSQLRNKNSGRVYNLEGIESSKVSLLMVYSIDSVTEGCHRVLIYQGENAKEQVIGIILITGMAVIIILSFIVKYFILMVIIGVIIPPANKVTGVYSDPYVRPSIRSFVRSFIRPSIPPNL